MVAGTAIVGTVGKAAGVLVAEGVGFGASMQPFNSIDISSESEFAATRSGLPSRLISPVATGYGLRPTGKFVGEPNSPAPLPRSTEILLELSFATAISG